MTLRAAALGVCLAVSLTGCDADTGASDDAVVQGRPGELDGSEFTLVVPNGGVRFQVGEPVDEITGTEAADGHAHEAPEGHDWIGVTWQFQPGADFDPFHRTLMHDPAQRTSLALVEGDSTFDLGDANHSTSTPADTRTSGIVYVPVSEGAGVRLEATFDGRTTAVDTSSGEVTGATTAFDGLDAAPEAVDCPRLTAQAGRADIACSYVLTSVPYLAGAGWSDDGWTVAQVETRVDTFQVGRSTYAVQGVTDASRLHGGSGSGKAESTIVADRLDSLVTRSFSTLR